jgi:hypothetical protein
MRNLELVSCQSFGCAVPAPAGARFERKLVYIFTAKEPGDAETGPIEVKYYRPEVKHEKVASEDTKKEPTAPISRTLPTLAVKVTSRTSSTLVPILILACAGVVVAFFAFRLLRKK